MNQGYKQRPPHLNQNKSAGSAKCSSNSPPEEHDPWTPKERQAVSPPRPTSIQPKMLISPIGNPSNWTDQSVVEEELSPYDLLYNLTAYDGTPIVIVPPNYFNVVAASFKAGLYGLDTESDCTTGELRIIQVYTQVEVYIFPATVLDDLQDGLFIKFLRSKDRIKVGVDIDNDICVIRRHINRKKNTNGKDQHLKNKFTVNGFIDIQSIARSVGEPMLSLDKLSAKYVEGFVGNASMLGTYNPPTDEQYIYAANDAILSLRIYHPLRCTTPSSQWMKANLPPPPTVKPEILIPVTFPIRKLLPGERDPTEFEEAARAILAEEQETTPLESQPKAEDARAKTPEPCKPKSKRKKTKNKRGQSANSDEIDRIVESLNNVPTPNQSKNTPTSGKATVSPELQSKFREKLMLMKKSRGGKSGRSIVDRLESETEEIIYEIEAAKRNLGGVPFNPPPIPAKITKGETKSVPAPGCRKFIFYDPCTKQSRTMCLHGADKSDVRFSGPIKTSNELIRATDRLMSFKKKTETSTVYAEELVKDVLPRNPGNGKEILHETLERLMALDAGFDEDLFYEMMGKVTFWMMTTNVSFKPYSELLLFVIDIPHIKQAYLGIDAVLIGNLFVNMAVDNGYLEIDESDNLRLTPPPSC